METVLNLSLLCRINIKRTRLAQEASDIEKFFVANLETFKFYLQYTLFRDCRAKLNKTWDPANS